MRYTNYEVVIIMAFYSAVSRAYISKDLSKQSTIMSRDPTLSVTFSKNSTPCNPTKYNQCMSPIYVQLWYRPLVVVLRVVVGVVDSDTKQANTHSFKYVSCYEQLSEKQYRFICISICDHAFPQELRYYKAILLYFTFHAGVNQIVM